MFAEAFCQLSLEYTNNLFTWMSILILHTGEHNCGCSPQTFPACFASLKQAWSRMSWKKVSLKEMLPIMSQVINLTSLLRKQWYVQIKVFCKTFRFRLIILWNNNTTENTGFWKINITIPGSITKHSGTSDLGLQLYWKYHPHEIKRQPWKLMTEYW